MRSWWGWGVDEQQVHGEELEGLAALVADQFGIETPDPIEPPDPSDVDLAEPRLAAPGTLGGLASAEPRDRLRHGHGQAFRDVARAVRGEIPTPPDLVVRPADADDVRRLLEWCSDAGIACIPYGGGSSVVGGVTPPGQPAVSLDLERLDAVRDLDATSLAAHIEAGALGPAIEDRLRPDGLTLRHFPQSWEFSSLGGWIATRAGGHYATGWTHIDDFVESVAMETPAGRWESRRLPASGAGPSPDRLALGSEGTLGVITDAWVKVQRRPTFRASATVSFGAFLEGAAAVRSLAQSGLGPANCRLLDPTEAVLAGAGDGGTVLVLGFESADHPQKAAIDRALELCFDHGGRCPEGPRLREGDETGTSEGGAGAWRDTFLRAPYLRDALIRLGLVVETFETAVTWDRFENLVESVGERARRRTEQLTGSAVVALRLTHAYADGAAPYFTIIAPGGTDPVGVWDDVKAAVSDAILDSGGTITHHHAVGRDHRPWYEKQRPALFGDVLRAAKDTLDPAGVCNPGVLLTTG